MHPGDGGGGGGVSRGGGGGGGGLSSDNLSCSEPLKNNVLCPAGQTLLEIFFFSRYRHLSNLSDRTKYQNRKTSKQYLKNQNEKPFDF